MAYDSKEVEDVIERLLVEAERLRGEIALLRAALQKYADPNYNGYNGNHEHAARALAGGTSQSPGQ